MAYNFLHLIMQGLHIKNGLNHTLGIDLLFFLMGI